MRFSFFKKNRKHTTAVEVTRAFQQLKRHEKYSSASRDTQISLAMMRANVLLTLNRLKIKNTKRKPHLREKLIEAMLEMQLTSHQRDSMGIPINIGWSTRDQGAHEKILTLLGPTKMKIFRADLKKVALATKDYFEKELKKPNKT